MLRDVPYVLRPLRHGSHPVTGRRMGMGLLLRSRCDPVARATQPFEPCICTKGLCSALCGFECRLDEPSLRRICETSVGFSETHPWQGTLPPATPGHAWTLMDKLRVLWR